MFLQGSSALHGRIKEIVPFINIFCNPSSLTTVKQKKDGSTNTVSYPQFVQLYNKYMGGVDKVDQVRKYYSCRRRSRKWWLLLLYFMVGIKRKVTSCTVIHQNQFIIDHASELMSKDSARKYPTYSSLDAPPSARFCERHFPAQSGKRASAESAVRMAS